MTLFDSRICALGEGTLWHPERRELFWFDVTGRRLLSRAPESGATREVALPEICSAAAWIDRKRLLIASETGLSVFDLESGRFVRRLADLEAENPATRSNDGRADPWGGFWIGTMGKSAEPGEGALYRYFAGELRRLYANLSIPNAVCFAPDRLLGYFADTERGLLFRVALDAQGWPAAEPEIFVDFSRHGLWPDGAVTMADGSLRVALWGAGAVVAVSPQGGIGARLSFPALHTTCPASGGPDYRTLFCSSATQGLSPAQIAEAPLSGALFAAEDSVPGKPEPAFRLDLCGDPR
ncbi:SMP-30/gluconolactonase/LRE family protein [Neomegalonema perideroedes]|uniref:SMP-30/gluconolactonase/LRE family protein n=1 Tax=Neomegalonema perideroedes TaxID=217219 RepID=UPI00036A80AE|nr:SMP-30/gluconolactonase/LRE family protein [Neomegalonema perideroedes]